MRNTVFRTVRVHAATLLVALSLADKIGARTDHHDKTPNIAIKNFGRVDDTYYRGAQPKGRDYADLAGLGVKTVIDLKGGGVDEPRMVQSAGMKFYRIPMSSRSRPPPDTVARFLTLANDPANQPVFVHCEKGRHRTGAMTAVYRIAQDGWTADRAYQEMREYGFGPAVFHSALRNFVYDYYDRSKTSRRPGSDPYGFFLARRGVSQSSSSASGLRVRIPARVSPHALPSRLNRNGSPG